MSNSDDFFAHAVVKAGNAAPKELPPSLDTAAAGATDGHSQPRGGEGLSAHPLDVVRRSHFSTTWRARVEADVEPGRDVALVVLDEGANRALRARFARVAATLREANGEIEGVLRVLEVAPRQRAYLADLWTAGTMADLSALRWPLRRRVEFVARIAWSLHFLHKLGLRHGCLCPENVLLDDDLQPVLADVGLASLADIEAVASYRDFAAPELKARKPPSERSDIFSVGRLLQWVTSDDEKPEIVDVIARCLASPDSRYASAEEVERALSAIAEKLPEGEPPQFASPAETDPSRAPVSADGAPIARRKPAAARSAQAAIAPRIKHEVPLRSFLARRQPMAGIAGLVAVAIAIGGAVVLGGSEFSSRIAFVVCLALGGAAATWLLPSVPRAPVTTRLALAGALAAFCTVVDPLALVYRAVAQHHLHGGEAERRAAVDEIVRLGRDFHALSLAGVDLSGLDLSGADLRGADLSRADLSRTRLWAAEVEGASFDGAKLEGADLDRTGLAQARVDTATCDATTRLPEGWRCLGSRISR